MCTTSWTNCFDTYHPMGCICYLFYRIGNCLIESWPATFRIKPWSRFKQCLFTYCTKITFIRFFAELFVVDRERFFCMFLETHCLCRLAKYLFILLYYFIDVLLFLCWHLPLDRLWSGWLTLYLACNFTYSAHQALKAVDECVPAHFNGVEQYFTNYRFRMYRLRMCARVPNQGFIHHMHDADMCVSVVHKHRDCCCYQRSLSFQVVI